MQIGNFSIQCKSKSKVDRLLTGQTAKQKGTAAWWYLKKNISIARRMVFHKNSSTYFMEYEKEKGF